MFDSLDIEANSKPWMQAIIAGLLAIIAMGVIHFIFKGNGTEFKGAFIGIVFYALINLVISIFHSSFIKYTLTSYITYFILTALLLLTAKAISGISIWQLSEYRFMFTSVTIFYLTAGVLVRVIRLIYEFADNEENID